MARKPNDKLRRPKPPSVRQRMNAQAKRAAADGGIEAGPQPRHKPDPRIDKAQVAWNQGRYEEAIWFYERCLPVTRTIRCC